MTNVPIEESLGFDISGALQGIGQIDDALTQVTTQFAIGLASALETLTSAGQDIPPLADSLDVAGLGPAVDAALDAAGQTPVSVEGDTTGLTSDIEVAIDTSASIPVDGDTDALSSSIDAATDIIATVPVDADTAGAQSAISDLEGETVTVDVEVDSAGAQQDIANLGEVATGTASGMFDLTAATGGFAAVSRVGAGEVGGLTTGIGLLGPQALAVGTGFAAGAGSIGVFFHQALDAEAAVQRLDASMGPLAQRIENLQVGDLNEGLSELALSLGSDDDALRNIAATFFNFQTGAGTSRIEASKFSETVLALSSRAVALNPALGSVEAVAGRLGNVLGRGGRFASQFGLDLSSAEIKARAAANATQGLGDGVSFASLQLAGGQLALEKYGDHLAEDIAQGTKNPIIQLSALRQKFEEATEAIGRPLVAPIFEILTEVEPVAESVGKTLGSLAQVALPGITLLAHGLGLLTVPLDLVSDGLTGIADTLNLLPGPLQSVVVGLGVATIAAVGFSTAIIDATAAVGLFILANPELVAIVGTLAALGAAVNFLGSKAHDSTVDTTGLADAFSVTADAAGGMFDAVSGATGTINAFLREQLALTTEGISGNKILSEFGNTVDGASEALAGGKDAFEKWNNAATLSHDPTDKEREAIKQLGQVLSDAEDRLQSNAKTTLEAAVASGTLSDADERAVLNRTRAKDGTLDYVVALRELNPTIRASEIATRQQQIAVGGLGEAFLALRPAIADGTLTAEDAQQVADDLGISLEDAEAAVKSLSSAMDEFVSGGLSALPSAGAAIEEFSSGISSAQSELDSVLKSGAESGTDPFAGVTKAQEEANRQLADNAEQTSRTVQTAKDKVSQAQAELAEAQRQGGDGQAAAVRRAQGQLDSANEGLTKAIETAGQSNADAVRDGDRKVSDARQSAADSQNADAVKAKEAQDAYLRAIDPQRVIDAEFKNAFAIGAFQANLTELLKRGRDNAVAALIAEGPEKGGQLANALVNDDTKAKAFDDGIAVANQVTSGYGNFLEEHKAELSGRLITLADGTVVDATDSFSGAGGKLGGALGDSATLTAEQRFHPNFASRVNEAMAAAATALAADTSVSQKAGEKGIDAVAAFTATFGPLTTGQAIAIALRAAGVAVTGDTSVATAAEAQGSAVAAAYLKGIVDKVNADGTVAISNQKVIANLLPQSVNPSGSAPKVVVPKADTEGAKTAGEQTGQAAQDGLTSKFKPAEAVTAAVQLVPPAIATGIQPAIGAATQAGENVTAFFAGHLHFGGEITANMGSIPGRIASAGARNNLAAAQAGFELGAAYGDGFAGGIGSAITDAANAAASLAAAADRAARKRLGVRSPSTVGADLGRQYVAGIVQGLAELSPLHAATAALTLALIPDLRPVLRQTAQLAPGIVAATPLAARPAGALSASGAPAGTSPTAQRIESTIVLNKTDPDPKHFADELAWSLQGF